MKDSILVKRFSAQLTMQLSLWCLDALRLRLSVDSPFSRESQHRELTGYTHHVVARLDFFRPGNGKVI
jgi:hypothetical protein